MAKFLFAQAVHDSEENVSKSYVLFILITAIPAHDDFQVAVLFTPKNRCRCYETPAVSGKSWVTNPSVRTAARCAS